MEKELTVPRCVNCRKLIGKDKHNLQNIERRHKLTKLEFANDQNGGVLKMEGPKVSVEKVESALDVEASWPLSCQLKDYKWLSLRSSEIGLPSASSSAAVVDVQEFCKPLRQRRFRAPPDVLSRVDICFPDSKTLPAIFMRDGPAVRSQ